MAILREGEVTLDETVANATEGATSKQASHIPLTEREAVEALSPARLSGQRRLRTKCHVITQIIIAGVRARLTTHQYVFCINTSSRIVANIAPANVNNIFGW